MKYQTMYQALASLLIGMLCSTALVSCTDDTDNDKPGNKIPVESILQGTLIKLTTGLGEWNCGVMYEKDGQILYKENEENAHYLQFVSPGQAYDCALYASRDNYLPQQLSFTDESFYFDQQGDTALVVSHSTDQGIETLDTLGIQFTHQPRLQAASRSSWNVATIEYVNLDDKIKKVTKALNAILNAGQSFTSAQVKRLKKALDDIHRLYYYENVEDIIDELDICREENENNRDSLIYCFAQYATKAKIKKFHSARFHLSVKTGSVTDVFSTFAVVNGRIFCPDQDFRKLGSWGIIYSTSPDNLSLENNEGIAYADTQGKADFLVELHNLKPNTRYYYKTFYQFHNKNHGNLIFAYGDKHAESYVDNDWYMKEFVTPKKDVYIQNISNGYPVLYEDDFGLGTFYPIFSVKSSPHIKIIYNIQIELKDIENCPLEIYTKQINFGDEGRKLSDFFNDYIDKWGFTGRIRGENSIKFIFTVKTKQGKKVSVETDWARFRYDWQTGLHFIG